MNKEFENFDVLLAIIDATPFALNVWNREMEIIASNKEALKLFGAVSMESLKANFFDFSPKYQPDGTLSAARVRDLLVAAFEQEQSSHFWMHCNIKGEAIPTEVTLVRIPKDDDYVIASFTRDMRSTMELEDKIKRFNMKLQAMLDASPLCLNLWNSKIENTMCNKQSQELFGLRNKEEYIERFFDLSPQYQPDGRVSNEKAIEKLKEAFETGYTQFNWIHCNLEKEEIPAEITLVRIDDMDEEGNPMVAGFTRDLRPQLLAQQAERDAATRINAVLNAMPLTCILWSTEQKIIDCNEVALEMFGADSRQDLAENFDVFMPLHQPDGTLSNRKKREKFEQAIKSDFCRFEWMYLNKKQQEIPCEVTMVKIQADEEIIVAYSHDLREIHQTLELNSILTKIAYYDAVTGCATRASFMEKLKERFQVSGEEKPLALLIFDIDYFKQVNDTYGHDVGDVVLKEVCQIVEKMLPEDGMLGRFGGDEFLVMLENKGKEEVKSLMEQMVWAIRETKFKIGEHKIKVSISVGGALKSPNDGSDEKLIKRADEALYIAKGRGRKCSVLV